MMNSEAERPLQTQVNFFSQLVKLEDDSIREQDIVWFY